MTNFIQPIDADLGRSVRCAIGRCLDEWLMNSNNLSRWETKITATERRILISSFVSDAIKYVMNDDNDKMRVGCFERTGCLITLLVNEEFDKKSSHKE